MTHIHTALSEALRKHWKAHNNAYPQKLVISPAQHAQLEHVRLTIRATAATTSPHEPLKFLGAKLEIDETSTGVMMCVDGSIEPLQQ